MPARPPPKNPVCAKPVIPKRPPPILEEEPVFPLIFPPTINEPDLESDDANEGSERDMDDVSSSAAAREGGT